ncbi:hypothetical protein Caci_1332 [Catenulispora acidiphila DSM 44928]|uniref:ABC3 transporter permease protein domain-containing protein n=1 Tax=Catenulispora acidiphila (strain DSM 44928 / JCM 14897 / NBRC 102108 / NRRL B-24433 / ID139908) TaxID=479433 RepID=C7Q7G7_CATAD|nr:hypothetical protein [Catenulispora acidiphila]ACU70255.1 hypothetical protein Caci_1332 [Catenulispora acidiphila DSM 44928]
MRRPRWWAQAARVRGALALLAFFGAATAATTAAVPYQISRSDRAIVKDSVGGAHSQDRDVTLTATDSDQFDNDFLRSLAARSLATMPRQVSALVTATDISVVSSGEYPIMDPGGPFIGPDKHMVHLNAAAVLGYEDHVRFVVGSAPTAPPHVDSASSSTATVTESAAISKTAADLLGLRVGSVVSTMATLTGLHKVVIEYTITGIYVADNPGDDVYWRYADQAQGLTPGTICGADEPDVGYVDDPKCALPQVVWRTDLLVSSVADVDAMGVQAGAGKNTTTIEYVVDASRIRVSELADLQAAVHRLVVGGQGLSLQDPQGRPYPFAPSTRLDDLAEQGLIVQQQARMLDFAVLGAALAAALAAFFLMLRTVVTQRSAEIVLCKARGARPGRLALRFAAQSSVVVAAASAAGVLIATAAGTAAGGTVRAWIGAVLLTLAGGGAVYLRVLAHDDRPGSARREVSEADAAARIPRLVRDIVVPLGAAASVGVLRSRGSANGSGSFDWLAIAAPALVASAAAVVVVRAVPVLWSMPFAVARRGRGTVPFVATALAGRRVPVLAAPLAGLVVASAAATFAAGLDSSVTQGVRNDALYTVGAGARIEAVPDPSKFLENSGVPIALPAGLAASAAAVPGAGPVMSAFVGAAEIEGAPAASANVTVLVADSGTLRTLTDRAAHETEGRSGRVPSSWPMTPSRPGTVTALVSPALAGLVGTHGTLGLVSEQVEVDFVAAADLPTASAVTGEYGSGSAYVVLPSDQLRTGAPTPNTVWLTGHPDINALRKLPGVQPYFPLATFAQASAAGYATGRVSAAHAVLRMTELLSVGFGLLCLAQTMAGARSAARDSALLLRVHGLSETGGRLLGSAVTLPLVVLAAAGGLAMGTALAPLLGSQVSDTPPSGGWLVPVIGAAVLCTVGGTALEAALRRRQQMSVRLRAAEYE